MELYNKKASLVLEVLLDIVALWTTEIQFYAFH